MAKTSATKPDLRKVEAAGTETIAKIAAAYEKLATKFREKAQRAASRMTETKNEDKRIVYRRRFELYGDAATDLEERVRVLKGASDETDT